MLFSKYQRRATVSAFAQLITAPLLTVALISCGSSDNPTPGAIRQSQRQEEISQSLSNKELFDRHKNDVHYDVVNFVAGLCKTTNTFTTKVNNRPGQDPPQSLEEAVNAYRTSLTEIADLGVSASSDITNLVLPEVNPVLTPGVTSETWSKIQSDTSQAFVAAAEQIRSHSREIGNQEYASSEAASAAISSANDKTNATMSELNNRISQSIKSLPMPNKETSDALAQTGACPTSQQK
ncbi:MAG: hypothetical protein ACRCSF_13965 [Mycobacteriaceae bacterium]